MMLDTTARRYDLDWLRIIAFGLLILYHVGMFYVTWGWHVKSTYASPSVEPLMRLVNPWRLALLFFISGIAIRFATDKANSIGRFALSRVARLGLPLLFGIYVWVMPQAYYQVRHRERRRLPSGERVHQPARPRRDRDDLARGG